MWTTAGLIGAAMYLLPGSPHEHLGYGLLIAAAAVLWGATSLLLWHKRWTMSLATRAVVTAGTAPLVAAAIWASGGASSFLQPLLLFTALFISYFFPARLAWPLMGLFAFVYSTPLLYDPDALAENFPRTRRATRSRWPAPRSSCRCSSGACCAPRSASA